MSTETTEQAGCARRSIDLRSDGDGVVAWLEDDFHHFGVELRHDGDRILAVAKGMPNAFRGTPVPVRSA